jgi:hypothetical protein
MLFLEVIFALTFIYFLGSIIVSGINEAISMLFNKRGLELKRAIKLLLNGKDSDWGDHFFRHPRIEEIKELPSSMSLRAVPQRTKNFVLRKKDQVRFNPSYIAASLFADVMIDFLGKGTANAVQQTSASVLPKDELFFIGQMRRFIEASDPYNYKQFGTHYLSGDHPEYPVLEDLRVALRTAGQDFHTYRSTALAQLDRYVEDHATMTSKGAALSHLKNRIISLQGQANFGAIQQFLSVSETLDEFKGKVEEWFNGYMDRVSGWYKRRMQMMVLYLAIIVTVAGNIDSIEIIQNLIVNQTFRETVVAAADQYLEDHPELTTAETFEAQIDSLKEHISLTKSLFLPVGVEQVKTLSLAKIAGWLITVFALYLGAPFWFDMMVRVANIRASGRKPPASTAT